MRIETQCLHEGYHPGNGEPRVLPIYQSTTYRYDSTEFVGKLFDMKAEGHMYSRISNPTVACVEDKIAALEGGVGALLTTSGQMANLISLLNILGCGDHFISSAAIYGGTVNLFAVTMKNMGIECTFIDNDATEDEIRAAFRPNTKAIFGEMIANPKLCVLDLEKYAKVAHEMGVPLIVDNTFATPVLCRPFEWGADIVTHSTSKYMDGHACVVGGAIVDGGSFDWAKNGRYPGLTEPDESYHGLVYVKDFPANPYITKARIQLTRDFGFCPPAQAAWLTNLGLETLALRVERHSESALAVARYLAGQEKVEFVNYPFLEGDKYYDLAHKYLKGGASGVVSFSVKGSREKAARFIDSLKLASLEVHVAEVRTAVLHPASSTHRQLTDAQLAAAGITPGLIRFSCGIENIEDILADIEQALAQV